MKKNINTEVKVTIITSYEEYLLLSEEDKLLLFKQTKKNNSLQNDS